MDWAPNDQEGTYTVTCSGMGVPFYLTASGFAKAATAPKWSTDDVGAVASAINNHLENVAEGPFMGSVADHRDSIRIYKNGELVQLGW